jgi:hypothetical protein
MSQTTLFELCEGQKNIEIDKSKFFRVKVFVLGIIPTVMRELT